jgi:hypothetical protein
MPPGASERESIEIRALTFFRAGFWPVFHCTREVVGGISKRLVTRFYTH